MDSKNITVVALAIIAMLLLSLDALVSWNLAQQDIIKTCEHASFFYKQGKTFECLPYKRGDVK